MEDNRYKVDVLRYSNPHMIWVLVHKEGDQDAIFFEQIGIYGILPQNLTLEGIDCVMNTEHCEQWMPAASVIMERCFRDAAEVWFSPTYIHVKSSLFDDNTHKYGNLTVVKKNGDILYLLEEIVQSEFGYMNETLFHQKLKGNNLNTQLNYIERYEVLKNIEEAYKTRDIPKTTWLNVFIKQTSVYQDSRHLEASIMSRRQTARDQEELDLLTNKDQNVMKLCKDVDEVSIGRASNSRSSNNVRAPITLLKKKLDLLECLSKTNEPNTSKSEATLNSENQLNRYADKNANATHSDVKTSDDTFEEEQNNSQSPLQAINKMTKGHKPQKPIAKNTNFVAYGPAGCPTNKFTVKPAKEFKKVSVMEYSINPDNKEEENIDSKVCV